MHVCVHFNPHLNTCGVHGNMIYVATADGKFICCSVSYITYGIFASDVLANVCDIGKYTASYEQ